MREMKDSGIQWIGCIPNSWNLSKLKYNIICRDSERIPVDSNLRVDGPYPYWGAGSIMDYIDRYIFDEELVLLGEDGAPFFDKKRDVAHLVSGKCWVNNHIHVLQGKKHTDNRYLAYYLNIVDYGSYINGSILNKLTQSNMNSINFCIPSKEEQKTIADFLDKKCSEIEALTKDIEKQIEVLEDYKKSVITEAVTKGLNPNVEMKDSGVEWIGSCPKNWDIIPFKYCLKERNEKNNPVKTDERLSLSIDKGVTLYSEKTTNLDRFKDDVSQYKIAHQGDFVLNSMNMIVGAVGISNYYGCVSPAYYVYYDELDNHISAKYCNYLFSSKPMRKVLFSLGKGIMAIDRGDDQINTCRLKVSRYDMLHLSMPWPTYCEQKEIVEQLDLKCSEISALILDKQKQLEILADYKKSLIYEYVTGKKEVM